MNPDIRSDMPTAVMEPPVRGSAVPIINPHDNAEIEPKAEERMAETGTFDADVVVIGSGPGGYVAAVRAAQLGGRVVCIERSAREWGGVCLNWGCIPTKTLIASVERYHAAKEAAKFGVLTGEVSYDFAKIAERKDKVVSTLRGGVEALLKSNHVRRVIGFGRITGPHSVEVTSDDGSKETISTAKIIVATGGEPVIPPIPGLEGPGIWTSNDAVSATSVPKSMVLVGAGAVGLEFAYVYNGLGTKCRVVEMMDEILPVADADCAVELRKSLTRQGITFSLGSKVSGVERTKTGLVVTITGPKGEEKVETEVVLLGAGRKPVVHNIGLEDVGVEFSARGIVVDDTMRTNVPSIYAIGDVTGKLLLAHVASHQGVVAAENCMDHPATMDYKCIPSPIFTEPEMSWVGLSEKQAREAGYDVVCGKFPFRPLGKAMAIQQQEGLVKIVSERKYGEVLGVHIIGPHASDLIHEGVAAIKLEATVEELMTMVHAHPSLAEAVLEAALDVKGEAIHKLKS